MQVTLEQAVRNAIMSEENARRFYERLSRFVENEDAKRFFVKMSEEEERHAVALANLARDKTLRLPKNIDVASAFLEPRPGTADAKIETLEGAIELAIAAEINAQLYYEALASTVEGEAQLFFERMAEAESSHYDILNDYKNRLK